MHFRKEDNSDSEFMVPKNLEVQLDSTAVHPDDMMQLHFYTEYQWLLDFALCALIVYFITEVYYYLMPAKDEVNLSILWCMLVVGFTAYPFKNFVFIISNSYLFIKDFFI